MQTNSHLSRLIHDQAEKYGDREVLIYKDFGGSEWKSYSWNQFSDMVKRVSNALLACSHRTLFSISSATLVRGVSALSPSPSMPPALSNRSSS